MSDLEAARTRVIDAGRRIRNLLTADARDHLPRTVRAYFVENQAFADELDAAALAELKGAATTAGSEAAGRVAEHLEDAVWLAVQHPEHGDETVTWIPEVRGAVEACNDRARQLFAERLPAQAEPPEWTLPARFIDGDDLRSATRALWKAVRQLRDREAQQAASARASSAEDRLKRWEDA